MTLLNFNLSQIAFSTTLAGVLLLSASLPKAVQANSHATEPGATLPNRPSGNLRFEAPGDSAPDNTYGGGTRGQVKFQAPGEATPENTTSGGRRGGVKFQVPGEAAPRNSTSGGRRGDIGFEVPGDSAPNNTASGATRSEAAPELTPLLPEGNYGRTVAAHPTFFVYMPPTASRQVFFSLQDEDRNHHYQAILETSGEGGIVSVTLPAEVAELEVGKNYVWFFAPIEAEGILRPDNYGVTGWVKRVEKPVENTSLTSLELAAVYAQSGIWYDTLGLVAAAKRSQPDSATFASEWNDLLAQVGLNEIAPQPWAEQL